MARIIIDLEDREYTEEEVEKAEDAVQDALDDHNVDYRDLHFED